MNIEYIGKNFPVENRVRAYTEDKLQKILKFLEEPIDVRVTLEQKKHNFTAELHMTHRHGVLNATENNAQMVDAINQVVDKVEKQARRSREKFQDKRRRSQRTSEGGARWPVEVLEAGSLSPGGTGRRIIKSSFIPIKPMSIEEAALQLEDAAHEFVVFRDAETDRVCVLYKRKDSNYGLIAPEV